MIRLFIHNDETHELDTYGDENIAITYSIDDITNIETKTGNYSKTFDLPATKNNNIFFAHLYDLQSDVSQFPTLIGQRCELFSNDIQIFEGLLFLNEIVKTKNETKYRVNLVGQTIHFLEVLGDATLSQLDFTDLNHQFNNTNVTNSATNTGVTLSAGGTSTDIYYSLVQNTGLVADANGNFTCFGNQNIQPFINLLHIVNKIFDFAGFSIESDFLNAGNPDFANIFMDTGLNDKRVQSPTGTMYRRTSPSSADTVSNVSVTNLKLLETPILGGNPIGQSTNIPHPFGVQPGGQGFLDTGNFTFRNIFTITDTFATIPFTSEPAIDPINGNPNDISGMMGANGVITSPTDFLVLNPQVKLSVWGTAGTIIEVKAVQTTTLGVATDITLFGGGTCAASSGHPFGTANGGGLQNLTFNQMVFSNTIILMTGDTLEFFVKHDQTGSTTSAYLSQDQHYFTVPFFNTQVDPNPPANYLFNEPFYNTQNPPTSMSQTLHDYLQNNPGFYHDDTFFVDDFMNMTHEILTNQDANYVSAGSINGIVDIINARIHDNHGDIKLADIIKDLFKMFNLVVEQRGQILKIEPFNDFLQTGTTKNWTEKIDTTETVQNYENLPSKITWLYNNDEDDAKLTTYKNLTGEDYGSMRIQLPVDYINEVEIKLDVFSAMSFSRLSNGAIYPNCYGIDDGVYEQIENRPRLIYKNFDTVTATIDDINDVVDRTFYSAGTHFEEYPANMTPSSLSLNFGYTHHLFSSVIFNQSNNNLFLKYWFDYVIDRYTADRVLVKAKIRLTESDILNFSFADIIKVKNQEYRVVKIEYNAGKGGLTKIEMLKI
jgi:hypothetical protein